MTYLNPRNSRLKAVLLSDVRAEFQSIFDALKSVIGSIAGTNRSQISDIYVDITTDELVITHKGGEKRIT